MNAVEMREMAEILDRLKNWPIDAKIRLARRILETLEATAAGALCGTLPIREPTRGLPVEAVIGLLKTDREPPDDEECRRIVEEERWKKYGSRDETAAGQQTG